MENGLFTRFMLIKYHHFACFRLSTYLYVLSMCVYVRAYNKKYSPENTNKITQMYGHLQVNFILYLTFTASLYDGKICLFSYGSGEINKQTHSWNS